LSLPAEYAWARKWLESLGPPDDVTVIPGNHDLYVPQAKQGPAEYWGAYMHADDNAASGTFPFVRRRGAVALIALSTALATGPFLATGRLGEDQLDRFADSLKQTRDTFRVVLIHHPPVSPPNRYLRRLIDAAEFRSVLAKHGADLVLHGHDHCRSLVWLDGPDKAIPAVGVPSASAQAPHGHEDASGYNIFRIDGAPGGWHLELITRQLKADESVGEVERRILL
jgi:3',5'-cyclic AMP phosphodiesterase CpdA